MLKDFDIGIYHTDSDDLHEKVKEHLKGVPWVGMYYLTPVEDPECSIYYNYSGLPQLTELTFTAEEDWLTKKINSLVSNEGE